MKREIIEECINKKVWALVGASAKPEKFGYKILKVLTSAGYTVFPINPVNDFIDEIKCYKKISDLPQKPEVVNFVIPPSISEKIVEECIEQKIERIWFQPGAESNLAIEKAKKAGLKVVYNACSMIEKKNWS